MGRFLKNSSNVSLIFIFALVGFVVVSYQNCAPTTGGSAFQIGFGSLPSTAGTLSVSAITLSQTTMNPGVAFTASATVASSSPIACVWEVTSGNALVSGPTSAAAISGKCSYSGVAPGTGAYLLNLKATDSTQNFGQANVAFQVGTIGATPFPTPPSNPTPVPTASSCIGHGAQCNQYTGSPTGGDCNLCCSGYSTSCQYYGSSPVCTQTCN